MKLSASPKSEHYFKLSIVGSFRVLLDGTEQKYVQFADEEGGVIVRNKLDENGDRVAQDGYLVFEKAVGRVEIVMP